MKKQAQQTDTFIISKNVALPHNKNNHDVHLIPQAVHFENHQQIMEQVAICINKKMPTLLAGETGTGKTSLIRYLAHKTNNCFRRINHNGGTTVEDIAGKILLNKDGTYWVDGVLIEAMRKGWWYLADEINASSAEINFIYHSLLDDDGFVVLSENGGEVVRPHENFRFFASMNPSTDYAGTKEINKALLSRFCVIKIDFSPPKIEASILQNRTGIVKEVAFNMVKFATEIRSSKAKDKLSFLLSTRDLILWADLYGVYKKYLPSAEMAILNKVADEDKEAIKDLLALHFKTIDNPNAKKR
jgi:midasin (ATPase involved in ribosome maturation)